MKLNSSVTTYKFFNFSKLVSHSISLYLNKQRNFSKYKLKIYSKLIFISLC